MAFSLLQPIEAARKVQEALRLEGHPISKIELIFTPKDCCAVIHRFLEKEEVETIADLCKRGPE